MTQREIIDTVANWLTGNLPAGWVDEVLDPQAMYAPIFYKLNAPDRSAVIVKPHQIEWVRKDRGPARRTHYIDILIFGGSKKETHVKAILDGIEQLGNKLMQMPFDEIDVYAVETLADSPAGYDQTALAETKEPFMGGVRVECRV